MLNLDTHVFLFAIAGELTHREHALLIKHPWSISAIVLWEIEKLSQGGRIDVDLATPEIANALRHTRVWPIETAIARASTRLDVRSDPADELIGATSIVHQVPLLTRDRRLRASKLIPLARPIYSSPGP